MNGVGLDDTGVLVLGATNIPWQLAWDNCYQTKACPNTIYSQNQTTNEISADIWETNILSSSWSRSMTTDVWNSCRKYSLSIHPEGLPLADRGQIVSQDLTYISTVVRDALMQPVRKVISATYFKQVANHDTENGEPSSRGDPVEKAWSRIGSDELLEPLLGIANFLKSLDTNTRPTVTQADIAKHDKWTMDCGKRIFYCFVFGVSCLSNS